MMKDYNFILKFSLQEPQSDPNNYVESLYAGGWDDALIGIGLKGLYFSKFYP